MMIPSEILEKVQTDKYGLIMVSSNLEELFPNMELSGSKATRIWTLSPLRGSGKSNRLKEFEKGWLEGEDAGTWADTVVEKEKNRLGRNLEKDEEARCRGKARFDCEKAAISSCFKNLGANITNSMIWMLVSGIDNFAVRFHSEVLPSIRSSNSRPSPAQDRRVRIPSA